jgi:ubiquinone/menaquinone biosynthesis C-methylase UbiE
VRQHTRTRTRAGFQVKSFSQYENYNKTSKTYDSVRRPIALDIISQGFEVAARNRGTTIKDLQILDAGCGTGNYTCALKDSVRVCIGLDFNTGMLEQAASKLDTNANAVLQQGSVIEMPFATDSFDAVVMNQVLHHLDNDDTRENWENVSSTLSEIRRVLRPGGAFILSTQTPQQHVDGFWWAPIVPDAAKTLSTRFPTEPWMKTKLTELGFSTVEAHIPDQPLIEKEFYLNKDGPFDPVFRNGDSTWALATPDELDSGLTWWQEQIDAGKAAEFLKMREELRASVGQTTSIVAY